MIRRPNAGYSLIEATLVVGLISVISSGALVQLKGSLSAVDADVALNTVVSQIRYARQVAVDQRRNVLIEFVAPASIRVTRLESDGSETILSTATLPNGFTFDLASIEDDTPDGYGNAAAVTFNGGTSGIFLGDGTFVDAGGIVMSGSVFTKGLNDGSARAVTLAGASGRVKQYYINDGNWVDR